MAFINCPQCGITIEILALNCQIFRCGVLKSNGTQINPHLNKIECVDLKEKDLIYGCGAPFWVSLINDTYEASLCDYI